MFCMSSSLESYQTRSYRCVWVCLALVDGATKLLSLWRLVCLVTTFPSFHATIALSVLSLLPTHVTPSRSERSQSRLRHLSWHIPVPGPDHARSTWTGCSENWQGMRNMDFGKRCMQDHTIFWIASSPPAVSWRAPDRPNTDDPPSQRTHILYQSFHTSEEGLLLGEDLSGACRPWQRPFAFTTGWCAKVI